MKVCKICKNEKELSEFKPHNKCKDGCRPECRECTNKKNKLNRIKHKDVINKKIRDKSLLQRNSKFEKKEKKLIEKYIGVEFGSYKVIKFLGYLNESKNSLYKRFYFEKICRFCGVSTKIDQSKLNILIKKYSMCNLCNESVNIHTHEKKCKSCGEWKPANSEHFVLSKNRRFGIHYYCIKCSIEKNRDWRKIFENRKKEYDQKRQRMISDPMFNLTVKIRNNIRASLAYKKFKKNDSTVKYLQCSFKEFKIWIENKFTDGMSWDNHGDWHLDHQIPCSAANTREELIELCHYTNYQPLWSDVNISKGSTVNIDDISEENKIRFNKFLDRLNPTPRTYTHVKKENKNEKL